MSAVRGRADIKSQSVYNVMSSNHLRQFHGCGQLIVAHIDIFHCVIKRRMVRQFLYDTRVYSVVSEIGDELTQTMKMRRNVIAEKYKDLIEDM